LPLLKHGDITKEIVRGIGIALFVIAAAALLPIVGVIGIMMLPLLTLFYRIKLGRVKGGVVPASAFLFMALILGGVSVDLFLILALFLLGFLLGECFEKKLPLEKTVGYACGAVTFATLAVLLIYSQFTGTGIFELISNHVAKNLVLYQSAYEALEVSEEKRRAFTELLNYTKDVLVRIMPGLFFSGLLFGTWITLILARPVFKKTGLPFPTFEVLNRWQAPDFLVWGVIGFGVMLLIPDPGLKIIGLNGLVVMVQIYFFQGIGIVSFYFEKKQMPAVMRGALFALIMFQIYLLLIVIGLGFFDMWLNIRRLNANESL
jgi:uncharacterized protein YybS (DUF2232 family)